MRAEAGGVCGGREELEHFAPRTVSGEWALQQDHESGEWEPFDVMKCRPDSWNDPFFYEGVSRSWSYNTQADFAGLVERSGGAAGFEARLDRHFEEKIRTTKETFMHVPYLYTYCNRPDKASATVRTILAKGYSTKRTGIPENEDMGCHSALYMCGLLGLYPMMGQDWYFLTAPAFTRSVIALGESGGTLTVLAPAAAESNVYIVGAKLDGAPLERAWVRHAEVATGRAVLELDVAAEPGGWGEGFEPPPSPLRGQ